MDCKIDAICVGSVLWDVIGRTDKPISRGDDVGGYLSQGTVRNIDDLSKIEGIEESTAKELIDRGKEYLIKEKQQISEKLKKLGVEDSLTKLDGMTQGMLVVLGEKNIKKLKDFAELSSDELVGGMDEIKGKRIKIDGYLEEFNLSKEEADNLIMNARKIVFAD